MISCTPRGRSRLPPASANGRPPPCVPASVPRRKLQARRRRIDPMEAPQNRSDGGATADLEHGEGYRGAPQGSGHTIQPVLQVADVRPVNAKGATGAQQSECFSGCCSLTVSTRCSPCSPPTSTASSWTTPSATGPSSTCWTPGHHVQRHPGPKVLQLE